MVSRLLQFLQENQANMLAALETLVRSESPSDNKQLVDQCGHLMQNLFERYLGISGDVIDQEMVGNHIKFTFGEGTETILIVGHFDTVWDVGRLPFRIDGNLAYGPGIFDMKAGLIQLLWALRAIKEVGEDFQGRVVCFFNSDEEIGSVTSRSYIESEAKGCRAALILEPSVAKTGDVKTSRKGVGICQVKIKGVAAHAGNHHENGVSAIEELAHQIIKLHQATDYAVGTTVNVGIVNGGTRTNVVADEAIAQVDFRIKTQSEAERVQNYIYGLKPTLQGTSIEVSGGLNRPPMERIPETIKLFEMARAIALDLEFDIDQAEVGGGSDGNLVSAMGVPTLDGLGAVGDGPHAENEHILIDKMPERAALVAHLILELCARS
jgi:glutamate carboxypeptidase